MKKLPPMIPVPLEERIEATKRTMAYWQARKNNDVRRLNESLRREIELQFILADLEAQKAEMDRR